MNVTSLALTGASALPAPGEFVGVRTLVSVAGRSTFRRVFGLRIQTGGLADRITFDAQAAQLAIEFRPLEYDAHDADPAAAFDAIDGVTLRVTLPAPMQFRKARLAAAPDGARIELYRLDGDSLASEFTKDVAHNTTAAGDFTDLRFALRLRAGAHLPIGVGDLRDVRVRGFPTGPRLGLAVPGMDPLAPTFFWVLAGEVGRAASSPAGTAQVGPALAEALQQRLAALEPPFPEVIDALLVAESDAPCEVAFQTLAVPYSLVRASFRSLLFRPDDVTRPGAFATRLQDASTPLTAHLRSLLAAETTAALERADLRAPPARLIASILRDLDAGLQADALYTPARFEGVALTPSTLAAAQASPTGLARARVNRSLMDEAFPDEIAPLETAPADQTEVLRSDGAAAALAVAIDLPRAASVHTALLRLESDLRGDAPAADPAGGAPAWDAPIPQDSGILVEPGRAVARAFAPGAAVAASAVALAVTTVHTPAELIAEIREDGAGAPAGRVVASGIAEVEPLDRPAWLLVRFREPALLAAAPHWIVVRATRGAALWLAAAESATTRVGGAEPKAWTDRGGFDHLAPLHQLWTAAAADGGNGSNGGTAARLRVEIAGLTLNPAAAGARAAAVDIAPAINAWLAAQPSAPAVLAVPIRIHALGRGSVTVHPPEIVYDV
jgi:hypothetical protein